MQPYRILAYDAERNIKYVLASMLSVDAETGRHNIYIAAKHNPNEQGHVPGQQTFDKLTYELARKLSRTITCKSNSSIIARYSCIRQVTVDNSKAYALRKHRNFKCWMIDEQYTIADCLISAMQDYCKESGLEILSVL